jgi:hypothetical protein
MDVSKAGAPHVGSASQDEFRARQAELLRIMNSPISGHSFWNKQELR